ncbi:hypothetical protein [Maribacter sp. 2-571]|uniref:hypothetical protein n=1 Tax=Maribacter sp. 2-571 TaxID=3417569 RepID=UPI003D3532B2
MKELYPLSCALLLLLMTSLKPNDACEYAQSNIHFIKTQTEKALSKEDINLTRYHAYKALNAIEKSKQHMKECGCDHATVGMEESNHLLKEATKVESISDSKNLLKRSLLNTEESLGAIVAHAADRKTPFPNVAKDSLRSRHVDVAEAKRIEQPSEELKKNIDRALEKYRVSLDEVVITVDCKAAREFAQEIYEECEEELLQPNLSEGRKYYNLKTKKITAAALSQIGECEY